VWIAGVAFAAAAVFLAAPKRPAQEGSVAFSDVKRVIDTRCLSCHAEKPAFQGLAEAPKGVKLDTPERIRTQALQIHQQTVLSKAMPLGNLTNMTEDERALLDRWYRSGANVK
jgi:uncharacterized membrane protein